MEHTKIKGVYYVKRSTHEKLKKNYNNLQDEHYQFIGDYSEVKMSFDKCAKENKELNIKYEILKTAWNYAKLNGEELNKKLSICEDIVKQKQRYCSPAFTFFVTMLLFLLGLLIGIKI